MNKEEIKTSNRNKKLQTHTTCVEISDILQLKDSETILLDKISDILNNIEDNEKTDVLKYQDSWLLWVACFYNKMEVVRFFIENGASTEFLAKQSKTSSNSIDIASNISKAKIIEEDIFLFKNAPVNNSTSKKVPKF